MMAFIRVIALALALAASSAWSSHPSESARNQYGAREDRPQPQLLAEATDHPREVHTSQQPGFINNTTKQLADKPGRRIPWASRQKRSYRLWSRRVAYPDPGYPSLNIWRPHPQQIHRPYFIPVYGGNGGITIYYPAQPLYHNPGVPIDNRFKPFQGPPYLPPTDHTVPPPTSTTMNITDRFYDGDNPNVFNGGDNKDDRPVWDSVTRPPQQPSTTSERPTRRPRPPTPETPPLVHNPTDPEEFSEAPVANNDREFTTVAPTRPTRPRPTTPRPRPTPQRPSLPIEPSRCVWAIISCCSASPEINYECFEQRGCTGAFWDDKPCDSDFARAAIAAALNYYNKK